MTIQPGGFPWSRFGADPRLPQHARLRASDADRSLVISALGDAYSDGRLDTTEYHLRLDKAAQLTTLGEVQGLLADLIRPHTGPVPPWGMVVDPHTGHRTRSIAIGVTVIFTVFFTLIWMMSGGGYFWPMWPIAGIALVSALTTLLGENTWERPGRLRKRRPGELEG